MNRRQSLILELERLEGRRKCVGKSSTTPSDELLTNALSSSLSSMNWTFPGSKLAMAWMGPGLVLVGELTWFDYQLKLEENRENELVVGCGTKKWNLFQESQRTVLLYFSPFLPSFFQVSLSSSSSFNFISGIHVYRTKRKNGEKESIFNSFYSLQGLLMLNCSHVRENTSWRCNEEREKRRDAQKHDRYLNEYIRKEFIHQPSTITRLYFSACFSPRDLTPSNGRLLLPKLPP